MNIRIAVLIPTFFRYKGLKRTLESLRQTAPFVWPVVIAEPDDIYAGKLTSEYRATFVKCMERRKGPTYAWNTGLAAEPNYGAYILGADDCYYLPNWLEELEIVLSNCGGSGLIGLNDGSFTQHYLMTRDFIVEHCGGVFAIPHYRAWFLDLEAVERAKAVNKYFISPNSKIVHDWHGSASPNYAKQAAALFEERKAKGFPNDFPPIIK